MKRRTSDHPKIQDAVNYNVDDVPTASPLHRFTAARTCTLFAWQGWRLSLPRSWNPVKLEGDYRKGSALFADMDRSRLALRWDTPRARRFNPETWTTRALRDEIGSLASYQAKPRASALGHSALLYIDPEPPGRDVFVTHSSISNRAVELIHHAHKRTSVFEHSILDSLADTDPADRMHWSIFDLACTSPAAYRLQTHRLNAGDLSLTFAQKHDWLTLRQIALASLALERKPLDRWLSDQLRIVEKHYAPDGNLRDTTLPLSDREISGYARPAVLRARFRPIWWLPRSVTTLGLHDSDRDRIILAQGTVPGLVQDLASSVGHLQDNMNTETPRHREDKCSE